MKKTFNGETSWLRSFNKVKYKNNELEKYIYQILENIIERNDKK